MSPCYVFFGRSTACENCASMLAMQKMAQVVKIDYAHPNIYIAIAEPILHEDKRYVLELLKNITHSGMIGIDGKEAVAMNRLLERRNLMMVRDALTNIYRETYVDTRLPHDIYLARSEGRKLSLILVSIQNLKEINDLHGSDAGDLILKEFAAVMKDFSRKSDDWSARFTGSELISVAFGLDETQTNHACKYIHDKLKNVLIPSVTSIPKVVFAVGSHVLDGQTMTTEELIAAARKNIFQPGEEETVQENAALMMKAFPNNMLSGREIEVASLLLAGKTNLEIAKALFVSLSTVKKHVASIFEKTKVTSRGKLSAEAGRRGKSRH